MAEPVWIEPLTKLGIGGVVLGVAYIVTPLLRDAVGRKANGNGKPNGSAGAQDPNYWHHHQRLAVRDVVSEQLLPAISRQTEILEKQTVLLTRLVTLQESRERRGE